MEAIKKLAKGNQFAVDLYLLGYYVWRDRVSDFLDWDKLTPFKLSAPLIQIFFTEI